MDIVYQLGKVTAAEVQDLLPDPPGYSSVRTLLSVLEKKGHLQHEREGYHYVYSPVVRAEQACNNAIERVMNTFFEGSAAKLVSAVLDMSEPDLKEDDLREILRKIEEARKDGR